jgi:phage terminase large subunit
MSQTLDKIPFRISSLFKKNIEIPKGVDLTVNRGGTSSGKTYSIMQVLIINAWNNPNTITTVVGQDIPNLKKGAVRDILMIISGSDWCKNIVKFYNKSDRIIYFYNGSIIEFNSYDDEQDAKNGKRDYAFFNEVNGVDYGIFEAIYVRTKVHTWVDFNPSGEFWLSDKKIEDRENVRTIQSTYEHNPFLDKSIIDKIISYEPTTKNIKQGTADEYRWKVYGKGEYAPLDGAIIKRWERGKFDDSLTYLFGIDWGYTDPFTLTKIAVDQSKMKIYVKQISYTSGLSMTQILEIVQLNCSKDDLIQCDSAEPMNIRYLRDNDYNAQGAWKGKGSIISGLRWLQEYLIVLDDSPEIENELNNYIWAEKRSETPIDKFNHAIDGIRYAYAWWRFNVFND